MEISKAEYKELMLECYRKGFSFPKILKENIHIAAQIIDEHEQKADA